ncbi:MAG: hypothetical protein H6738_13145 [Alphaproteobacteria bacterium]|nr:hypothetical protein [Alphaproteobacteria bacterium]MCB9697722.1 hypothetical protein [Alphaproteobacteria bacterium]
MWRAAVAALVFVTLLLPRGPALIGAIHCRGHHTLHASPCCPEKQARASDDGDDDCCTVVADDQRDDEAAVPVLPAVPALPAAEAAVALDPSPAPRTLALTIPRRLRAPPALGPPPDDPAGPVADVWLEHRSLLL